MAQFALFVNGKYVNPLSVELPNNGSSELPEAEKADFFTVRDAVMAMIGG